MKEFCDYEYLQHIFDVIDCEAMSEVEGIGDCYVLVLWGGVQRNRFVNVLSSHYDQRMFGGDVSVREVELFKGRPKFPKAVLVTVKYKVSDEAVYLNFLVVDTPTALSPAFPPEGVGIRKVIVGEVQTERYEEKFEIPDENGEVRRKVFGIDHAFRQKSLKEWEQRLKQGGKRKVEFSGPATEDRRGLGGRKKIKTTMSARLKQVVDDRGGLVAPPAEK